jgi:type I restriction enzyme R subunit
MIDKYNSESLSVEDAYNELIKQARNMKDEEERAAKNSMSEEELELFDLLKKEKLTKKEEQGVKLAAHKLLEIIKEAKSNIFISEWHRDMASQESVKDEIQKILHENLPESYHRDIFVNKTNIIYQHIYDMALRGKFAS